MRSRLAAPALSLLVLLGLAAPYASAATPPVKVVIVVGATGSATSTYISYANTAASDAAAALPGATIVKVYSPNATWAAVSAALQGANFVIYLGHGTGYPSPYPYSVYGSDGMGLNKVANQGDSNTQYYGEWYLANQVRLAANAVVILSHLCYASGNNEPGTNPAAPTLDVAKQRIDNYGAGFIAAGAAAVIAEAFGDPGAYFRYLAQPGQSVQQIWSSRVAAPSWLKMAGTPQYFASVRKPGFTAGYDPSDPVSDPGVYHRSIVLLPGLTTTNVLNGTAVAALQISSLQRSRYAPLPPTRLLDTRIGLGFGGPLASNTVRKLQVTGQRGVPAGASAVTVNLTVVGQTAAGYLSIGPSVSVPPSTSTLNFPVGDVRANGQTVPLAADGSLSLVYAGPAGASTQVVLDVTGAIG